jgi:hypothetical protein
MDTYALKDCRYPVCHMSWMVVVSTSMPESLPFVRSNILWSVGDILAEVMTKCSHKVVENAAVANVRRKRYLH